MKYLKELCLLPGVSSFEAPVREYIEKEAKPYADTIRTDVMGNLIITKKGKKQGSKKLMLTAHMDEVGFIVKKVDDEGFIKFAAVGGIDPRVLLGRKVLVGPKKTPGIIGLKAIHLVPAAERRTMPKVSSMYIDIGASSKSEAAALAKLGDPITFDSSFTVFGDGLIKAKALDDRFGCAVLLNLIKEDLPQDVTFVFSVQEEVGTRGAFGAAFSVKPDIALVVEGTTSADMATTDEGKKITRVGAGPVIGFMDAGTVYDRGLFEMTRDLAEEAGIPWQIKEYIAGGTDASAIQRSREGVRVASISAPVRYIHSQATVASKKDTENGLKLARLFVEAVADGKARK